MLEYFGKDVQSTIMLPEAEDDVVSQLYDMMKSPMFTNRHIRIMPDTHVGDKCLIGLTSKYNGYIHPSAIGVDIGCGMIGLQFRDEKIFGNFETLDKTIRKNVPVGFNIHTNKKFDMEIISKYAQKELEKFTRNQKEIGIHNEVIDYSGNYVSNLCKKIDTNEDQLRNAMGTLGGGNHFIEVDIDNIDKKWLIIHSGSRNFGLKVANYHAKIADKSSIGCLTGDQAYEYIADMLYAQAYASYNRYEIAKEIMQPIIDDLKSDIMCYQIVESIHNFVSPSDLMIRKGAISSYCGESMIIPFNMRDGTIICEGTSNPEWNFSAPHGAGRCMSRREAKRNITMEQFEKDMKGIYTTCVNANTLDEAPEAYKDKEIILKNIEPTAMIKYTLKPVFNLKG